jgi:putative solute:sodium symporter small subunit
MSNEREHEDKDESVYHHDDQGNPVGRTGHDSEVLSEARLDDYWRANLRLLGSLLAVWFMVSFGAGIIFADTLDSFSLLGFPLGFWFAQQGGIYVFVILIFIYVARMRNLDKAFGVDDEDDDEAGAP